MGTMVWTSPGGVHLQINRNDVFAVNRNHGGSQFGPTDYCGRLRVPDRSHRRRQLCSLQSVSVRCFVSSAVDLLVMEIDDQRESPQPLKVNVAMLREPEVRTGEHLARTVFVESADRVLLTRSFQERDYYNASAVTVALAGVDASIETPSAKERTVVAPAVWFCSGGRDCAMVRQTVVRQTPCRMKTECSRHCRQASHQATP